MENKRILDYISTTNLVSAKICQLKAQKERLEQELAEKNARETRITGFIKRKR